MNKIHIGLIFLVLVLIVLAGIAWWMHRNNSGGGSGGGIDDSDIPIAPSTLEYNATYAPPKRNFDLSSASARQEIKSGDLMDDSYIEIVEDSYYKL
jgi:hypothetical protein